MEKIEWDSDSDGPEFYEPTGKELEEFLNNTEDTISLRSSSIRSISTITSCKEDEEIVNVNNALALNKQADAKYKRLEEVLYKSLLEVRQKIKDNSKAIMCHSNAANDGSSSYLRSGKPYFKDKDNFTPPDNEDTIMMRQAKMYDFSNVSSVPGWTIKDKTELVNALQEISRELKKNELNAAIEKLRKENKPENLNEILKLEKEIILLKKKSLLEIALPVDQEYDWEALSNKLNRRHTAQEYQALWKLFFHPSINKSNWSKSEHQELQRIASENNMQDWDLIAKQLGTGRTGYQCFVYYRTNMVDTSSNRKWSTEEVEYLQRVIDYFREGTYIPWGKVATAMDNRTKIQVYNKYTRMMERRKGRFLEEEDIVILNCYDKYGVDFKKISEYLPGRSAVQLRTRFNLLTKFRLSTTWTIEDDKKLLQIMANQDTNSSFSTATQHFPGKDRMHIRSRYTTLMRWMKKHPATDIAMAPRRGARRLVHGYANMTLNEALANLNKRMESEVKSKKTRRITKHSREEDIEDGIMAALINEILKEELTRKPDRSEIGDVGDLVQFQDDAACQRLLNITNLRKMLILLNAHLDKEKFDKSKYGKRYKGLDETPEDISLVNVKSYSKKHGVQTIEIDCTPDVWGNVSLGITKYVLPPNFATITGCRVLMNNVSMRPVLCPDDDINLSLMARRNVVLKDALCTLKERFTSLFLWPMLLSNESPNLCKKPVAYVPKQKSQQRLLPQPPSVTIPPTKKSLLTVELNNQTKTIDLTEDQNLEACNVSEELCNSDLLNSFDDDSFNSLMG